VGQVQQAAANALKNGNPPDSSLPDTFNVPDGPLKDRAKSIVSALRAPYESEYNKASKLSTQGSQIDRIKSDTGPENQLPTSIPWYTGANALLHPITAVQAAFNPAGSPDNTVQLNPDTQAKITQQQQELATAMKEPSQLTGRPLVAPSISGGYSLNVPSGWRPSTNAAPAPTPQPQVAPQLSQAGSYRTPADVKSAFQSGKIDRNTAKQILQQQFGM
jgi:hypothetical protein